MKSSVSAKRGGGAKLRHLALMVLIIGSLSACNGGHSQASDASTFSSGLQSGLAAEVELSSSLSEIKKLQYTYAQYGQYGLWDEMTSLFSGSAEIVISRYGEEDKILQSRDAIRSYLMSFGDGSQGLPVGGLYTEIYLASVVTLSDDSRATGRWQKINMRGQVGGDADWSGGFMVNDYVKEDGVWKLARIHIHEQFEGPVETGWFAVGDQIPFVPYHFTVKEGAQPISANLMQAMQDWSTEEISEEELSDAESAIQGLLAEDAVEKMQAIYGYYADRKMWDDIADLFMDDAAYEIAGVGIYQGVESIRRGLERDGPLGLQHGQVNDHLQMHTVLEVDPNGVEATARGMQWGFLTPDLGQAYWMISTFVNRYVLHEGIWRINEMRIYPKMKTDYYVGWHKSEVVDPVPVGALAPDMASSADNSPQVSAVIPVFFNNPVTGEPVSYPEGYRVVGDDRLAPAPAAAVESEASAVGSVDDRIEQARHRLGIVNAVDAVQNVQAAWGMYFEDYQWQQYAESYAADGWRRKGSGNVYQGPAAIYEVESRGYGPSPTWDRDWIRPHVRVQPVIDVSEDGQSAFIRSRMVLYFANTRSAGAFNSGMYGSDAAVLVDGVWKLSVGGWIDQTYFSSRGYELGWAKPDQTPSEPGQGRAVPMQIDPNDAVAIARSASGLGSYPPDLNPALGQLGRRAYGVVGGQPGSASWPDIKPMWFHYVNPASGRVPEFYCADVKVCVNEPMEPFAAAIEAARAAAQ
jgi:hypothetical protein